MNYLSKKKNNNKGYTILTLLVCILSTEKLCSVLKIRKEVHCKSTCVFNFLYHPRLTPLYEVFALNQMLVGHTKIY